MNSKTLMVLASAALIVPSAAQAELPGSVKAMIDAAIAGGDPAAVATVIDLAKQTNPDDLPAIEAIEAEFAATQEAAAVQAAAAEEEAIRSAGLLDNWSGSGEIGAFRSTGNSSNTGVSAGIDLERTGIKWRHKLTGLADFQRSAGITTREQFLAAYEANYDINDRLFAYGLAQWERDRFQGFSSRISASGGLGYRVIDNERMQLSVKGGPAFRQTNFVGGGSDSGVAALGALDFDWQITDTIKFTEDASAYIQSGGSSFNSTTGLEAALGSSLTARVAYVIDHETNPPLGAVRTDTLTRFTLIYGF